MSSNSINNNPDNGALLNNLKNSVNMDYFDIYMPSIHCLSDQSISSILEQNSISYAEKISIKTESRYITYLDLYNLSKRISFFIKEKIEEKIIVIVYNRDIETIALMLGIVMAGKSYVFLDLSEPKDSIDRKINKISTKVALSSKKCEFNGINVYTISRIFELIEEDFLGKKVEERQKNTPLYIKFSSGTTGAQKAILINDGNLLSLNSNANKIGVITDSVVLLNSTYIFDASVFEMWLPLLNGATIFLNESKLLDHKSLSSIIKSQNITTACITTSLYNQLATINPDCFSGLQYLIAAGEQLKSRYTNPVLAANPNLNLINGYGPTENTVFSTVYRVPEFVSSMMVPIGHPLKNIDVALKSINSDEYLLLRFQQ